MEASGHRVGAMDSYTNQYDHRNEFESKNMTQVDVVSVPELLRRRDRRRPKELGGSGPEKFMSTMPAPITT